MDQLEDIPVRVCTSVVLITSFFKHMPDFRQVLVTRN
jgi:hypothetical protein